MTLTFDARNQEKSATYLRSPVWAEYGAPDAFSLMYNENANMAIQNGKIINNFIEEVDLPGYDVPCTLPVLPFLPNMAPNVQEGLTGKATKMARFGINEI